MKTCPNCRMETRPDADWCWHCGYSYEEAEARATARAEERNSAESLEDEIVPIMRGHKRSH